MPASATVTTFHVFSGNTRARASEMNTDLSMWRGHIVPIDPNTATSATNTYDLGALDNQWRTGYFQSGPYSGGFRVDRTSFINLNSATTYNLTEGCQLAIANLSSGAMTVRLPYGSGFTGMVNTIKRVDNTNNLLTISSPTTTATIDGTSSVYIGKQYRFKSFMWDGTNYHLIDDGGPENIGYANTTLLFSLSFSAGLIDLSIPIALLTTGKRVEIFAMQGESNTGYFELFDTGPSANIELRFVAYRNTTTMAVCNWRCMVYNATATGASEHRISATDIVLHDSSAPAGLNTYLIHASIGNSAGDKARFESIKFAAREVD